MARKRSSEPHPLDVALGWRIRLRRKDRGLTQSALASLIGITFQQVQKYETGDNRVSFSRLMEIATALACSVSDLVSSLHASKGSASRERCIAQLKRTGANKLLEAYVAIKSPVRRRILLNLVRQLGKDPSADASPRPRRRKRGTALAR
ncbi:MAG TPA: helix-turn-helix transcriptional regulator [Rhizomicrobium sp.]|jgi:transcriptional regulator with XRE-family HTH domain|nr:helix-turn-helix transcriptional regulator [Rhizomicrobium sp.]